MIQLIISLVIILITVNKFIKVKNIYENILLSVAALLGISGIFTFLANEFINIPFKYSSNIILVCSLVFGLLLVLLKETGTKDYKDVKKINSKILFVMVGVFSLFILIRGYLLPIRGWDTFSLYDSRAKILLSGLKLSEMKEFSKYDEFNQLYYFSYPPMTSSLHAVFYAIGNNHIMFIYALFYVLFIGYVYLIIDKLRINQYLKILIFFISALNPLIFTHTKIAYTNLPAIAFQLISLFYLVKFAESEKRAELVLSALFICFANWTRSLEPIFISFFVAFVFVLINSRLSTAKKISNAIIYFAVSMSTWLIWHLYISTTIGGLGDTSPTSGRLINSIFNSLLLANLIDVVFFLYKALYPVIFYFVVGLASIAYIFYAGFKNFGKNENIIAIIIIITNLLMIGGTLYFSVTFTWWNQIPDSYLRSNLIMIPLMGILTGFMLQKILDKKVLSKKKLK